MKNRLKRDQAAFGRSSEAQSGPLAASWLCREARVRVNLTLKSRPARDSTVVKSRRKFGINRVVKRLAIFNTARSQNSLDAPAVADASA